MRAHLLREQFCLIRKTLLKQIQFMGQILLQTGSLVGEFITHRSLYFFGRREYTKEKLSPALRDIGADGLIGRFAPLPGLRPSVLQDISRLLLCNDCRNGKPKITEQLHSIGFEMLFFHSLGSCTTFYACITRHSHQSAAW